MAAPITRSAEWSFLRFVRALYRPERADGEAGEDRTKAWEPSTPLDPARGLQGDGVSRPVFENLLPVVSAGTWNFLTRAGGYRRREAVCRDRAKTGRLWDESVWGSDPLRLSAATPLWLAAAHDARVAAAVSTTGARAASERTLSMAGKAPITAGDRLALPVALLAWLPARGGIERLPPAFRDLSRRLPLLGIGWPSGLTDEAAWTVDPGPEDLALQYLGDWAVAGWIRHHAFHRRQTPPERRARDRSLSRVFDGLFRAARSGSADHLLGPITCFFPRLWREEGGAEGMNRKLDGVAASLTGQGEREELRHGYGTVLHAGVRLDGRVDEIQAIPWADRTPSQKRLAADYETHYRPVREDVRALARRLRRELG